MSRTRVVACTYFEGRWRAIIGRRTFVHQELSRVLEWVQSVTGG
jgi:hypothetical protein